MYTRYTKNLPLGKRRSVTNALQIYSRKLIPMTIPTPLNVRAENLASQAMEAAGEAAILLKEGDREAAQKSVDQSIAYLQQCKIYINQLIKAQVKSVPQKK
ncbi:MAG: hypothetical protein AAF915_13955 [Cyanobacteria bacterium P01_D01_bin.50]